MIGYFAISLAGHDKGQMYLIVGEEKDILFLADGNNRKMDHPKKTKKKHLQIIKKNADAVLTEKIKKKQTVYNEEIKLAIKNRKKEEVTHV